MAGGVHVLPEDEAVLERKDVDAVPLEAPAVRVRRGRRPLADDETVSDVQPAATESEVRPVGEDRRDVVANGVPVRMAVIYLLLTGRPWEGEREGA